MNAIPSLQQMRSIMKLVGKAIFKKCSIDLGLWKKGAPPATPSEDGLRTRSHLQGRMRHCQEIMVGRLAGVQ